MQIRAFGLPSLIVFFPRMTLTLDFFNNGNILFSSNTNSFTDLSSDLKLLLMIVQLNTLHCVAFFKRFKFFC